MPFILNSKKFIKIGVDGGDFIPFSKVDSGIQRIVDSFLKTMVDFNKKKKRYFINYYYFGQQKSKKFFNLFKFKKLPKKFFSSFFLPLNFLIDKNDVFLGFSSALPFLIVPFCSKKIVFLYDLGFMKFPYFYSNFYRLKKQTEKALRQADKVVVLSESIRKEIKTFFLKKTTVIYPGLNHLDFAYDLKKKFSKSFFFNKQFFLYVGVVKPIKNLEKIFYFFYHFVNKTKTNNCFLVIIGKKEKNYFKKLLKDYYFKKIKKRVIFKEALTDKELVWYYQNALSLLNFSYEEGFCFPVFEALYLKNFAIVNSLPIYHEFKKYFPNLIICKNDKEVILAMEEIMLKKKRRTVGCLTPENFTWKNFAQKLLELVEN